MKAPLTPAEAHRKLSCQKKHSLKKSPVEKKMTNTKIKDQTSREIFIENPSREKIWTKGTATAQLHMHLLKKNQTLCKSARRDARKVQVES